MPFFRETTISNLLLLGVTEIGATGLPCSREQKNSGGARFADATTIDERQAGQAAGLPTSFLELFSFWQRKKWNVPLYQKDNFIKSPVSAQKRNTLFIYKIFRVGKI